jgi:hypothetical protein
MIQSLPLHTFSLWHGSPLWAVAFPTTRFFRGESVNPTPNPNLEDRASVFVTPGDRVTQLYSQALGTHFSRLLRHAWATLGLFLSPGHHTGIIFFFFKIAMVIGKNVTAVNAVYQENILACHFGNACNRLGSPGIEVLYLTLSVVWCKLP